MICTSSKWSIKRDALQSNFFISNILVNLAHQKFHFNLEKVIRSVIKVEIGKEVEVGDLMHRLKDVAPDIQNLEQESVLRTVGKIFRKTLKRRGKQRK